MSDGGNPWMDAPVTRTSAVTEDPDPDRTHLAADQFDTATHEVPPLTGPAAPQHGVPGPPGGAHLGIVRQHRPARLWILGVHGGAGETSLALLDDEWQPAMHRWPLTEGHRSRVLLVARSNAVGLETARIAITQWAAGQVGFVDLLGLAIVADAPGRHPQPLRDLARNVSGGAPRTWHVPWIEDWRLGVPPSSAAVPRPVRTLVKDLRALSVPDAQRAGR